MQPGYIQIGDTWVNMGNAGTLRFVPAHNYPRSTGRAPDPARFEITVGAKTITTTDSAEIKAVQDWIENGS